MHEIVVPEEHSGFTERLELQRQVIDAQAEVLLALGFDLNDFATIADATAETETPPPKQGRLSRWVSVSTFVYLFFNLLSPRVPGPATSLGVGKHAMILMHLDRAADMTAHAVMQLH